MNSLVYQLKHGVKVRVIINGLIFGYFFGQMDRLKNLPVYRLYKYAEIHSRISKIILPFSTIG